LSSNEGKREDKGVQVNVMTSKGLYCHFWKGVKAEEINWIWLREIEGKGKHKHILTVVLKGVEGDANRK